jgi:Flp pilus assembly protein TadD
VATRIALAICALAVASALGYELWAFNEIRNTAELTARQHPDGRDVSLQVAAMHTVNRVRPGSQGSLAAAALELRTGRLRDAIRDSARATRREPDNFSAWVTLAVAQGGAGDRAGERTSYARAHELNPLYPIPH